MSYIARFLVVPTVMFATVALAESAGLAGSEWRPVRIGSMDVAGDADMFLQFRSGGDISGSTGCNRFFGTFAVSGGDLTFGPIGVTRRACLDNDKMALERALLSALESTSAYARDGTRLRLLDADGSVAAHFVQSDWD